MQRNRWAAVAAGLLVITLACESTTLTPGAPTPTPGAYPPLVVDADHQATVEAVQVERYLKPSKPRAAPIPRPGHSHRRGPRLGHLGGDRDRRGPEIQRHGHGQRGAGSGAPGCGHRHGHRSAKAEGASSGGLARTATADAVHFTRPPPPPSHRPPGHRDREAIAIEATATASAHQAQREAAESAAAIRQAELATKREELIYPLKAYGPWALVVLLAGLFAFAAIRFIKAAEVRARAIRRDARGDAPLLAFPNGRGGMLVYDPDRSFGPVAILDGEVSMPSLVDEDQQAAVTMRDQAVDLATRGVASPPRKRSSSTRKRQAQRLAMTGAPPRVQVIPPTKVAAWLQDVRPKALAMTIENPQTR